MKKLYARIAGVLVMLPMLASAQSTLDGTWKIDLDRAQLLVTNERVRLARRDIQDLGDIAQLKKALLHRLSIPRIR